MSLAHTTPAAVGAVEIRPLEPDDRRRLGDAFERLGDQTRRDRFGHAVAHLARHDLDALTAVDHHCHEALAAVLPATGDIIGVARYIRLPRPPGAGEVAVAVDDAWQGLGIGRALLAALVARARAEGVTRLIAHVGADNRRVRDWVTRHGGLVIGDDGDALTYAVAVDPDGRPDHRAMPAARPLRRA